MRALIISAVLLAVVVIFVFSSSAWLSGFFSKLLDTANGLDFNSPESSDKTDKAEKKWKTGKFAVLLFFDKEETDNIDSSLDRLLNAEKNNDEKEYTAAAEELRFEIKRMKDMLDIRFVNIF